MQTLLVLSLSGAPRNSRLTTPAHTLRAHYRFSGFPLTSFYGGHFLFPVLCQRLKQFKSSCLSSAGHTAFWNLAPLVIFHPQLSNWLKNNHGSVDDLIFFFIVRVGIILFRGFLRTKRKWDSQKLELEESFS